MHAHTPSSFDEPLASAMGAEIAYDASADGRRGRIPNGAAQQSARSRAALSGMSMGGGIPIRVMEGVGGMIRREMDRVKSGCERARVAGRGGSGDTVGERRVPLEFDEQDEDFGGGVPVGEGEGDGDGDGEDLWRVWSEEDRLAVDEAETFDDVLGIMDEDQPATAAGKGMSAAAGDQW